MFLKSFKYHLTQQRGVSLVGVLVGASLLATIAVSSTYFFTQSKITLSSTAQDSQCSMIAKKAIDRVVSLGTRLYGYKISSTNSASGYNPLFIKSKSGTSYGDDGNWEDVKLGQSIPASDHYKKLYKSLMNENMPTLSWVNTGIPLVNVVSNTNQVVLESSSSVLLINSVNFLQYLYNKDPQFFKGNNGLGKKFVIDDSLSTLTDDRMHSLWYKYRRQYNLQNMSYYIKITPVRLPRNELLENYNDITCYKIYYEGGVFKTATYNCPRHPSDSSHKLILTSPRLSTPASTQRMISSNNHFRSYYLGNNDLGFQFKVKLKYEKNGQEMSCESMRIFSHQTKTLTGNLGHRQITVESLVNGHNKNLLPNTARKQTSCDTDGNDYNDITAILNFGNFAVTGGQEEAATLLLCRASMACVSGTNRNKAHTATGCTPQMEQWRRCHNFKFPQQSGSTTASLLANNKLRLTFNDLQENRRYDLEMIEVSTLERSASKHIFSFYIDAKRPTIDSNSRDITNDAVGRPSDGRKGRRYHANRSTNWQLPTNSLSNKWIQCNQENVQFKSLQEDQFTHNLEKCNITGKHRDGSGQVPLSGIVNTSNDQDLGICQGELQSITHGRQTVIFEPEDICDVGVKQDLVWDTDLPNTFKSKDFNNLYWFTNQEAPYEIDSKVPAKTTEGKFPKHYTMDCFEKEYGNKTRTDGNGGIIRCQFVNSVGSDSNGCNPQKMGARYYHVCGGNECQDTNRGWGIYVAEPSKDGGSCQYVECQPGLICCDGYKDDCGGVDKYRCVDENRHSNVCIRPRGGGNDQQDSQSGCPPLGLYNCRYTLPCNATKPFSGVTGPTSKCHGKKQNDSCQFSKGGYTCQLTESGSRKKYKGLCAGQAGQPCSVKGNQVGERNCKQCPVKDKDGNPTGAMKKCNCDPIYAPGSKRSCTINFNGICGTPNGGCGTKGVGGRHFSQDKCSERKPICSKSSPPKPPKPKPDPTASPIDPDNPHGACGDGCSGDYCASKTCGTPLQCHVRDVGGVCYPSCGHACNLMMKKLKHPLWMQHKTCRAAEDKPPPVGNGNKEFFMVTNTSKNTPCALLKKYGTGPGGWKDVVPPGLTSRDIWEIKDKTHPMKYCCYRDSIPSSSSNPVSDPITVPESTCEYNNASACNDKLPPGTRCHQHPDSGCFNRRCQDGYIKNADGIGCIAVDTPGPSKPKCTCNTPHLGCGYPCSAVNRNTREIRKECHGGVYSKRRNRHKKNISCDIEDDLIRHTITQTTWTCSKAGYTDSELCSRTTRRCEAPTDGCRARNVCTVSSDGPRTCTYTEKDKRMGVCRGTHNHTCGPDSY